jgi:hypothetical protein
MLSPLAVFLVFMTLAQGVAKADDDNLPAGAVNDANKFKPRGRIELKRDDTNRGTSEETTKTSLKISTFLDGPVSMLRLELPFPDDRTDFWGNPFNPRMGDIKTRVAFKAVRFYGIPLSSFIEVTFPTANPEELGAGKYQLSGGLRASMPLYDSLIMSMPHQLSFDSLIQQVVSVAGDASRKNMNYTKFEVGLKSVWQKQYWVKLTAKPVLDWEQDAKTGAVAELEVGWNINRHWDAWVMSGARMWGEGVPSTYGERVGIGVALLY